MRVRLKLALSYAAVISITGGIILAVVWVFLLRYVPDGPVPSTEGFIPNRGDLLRAFLPAVAVALLLLFAVGMAGGWLLAGRMLAPLSRISRAARRAAHGTLSHRIASTGPHDEFRELADGFDRMLEQLEAHVGEQQRFAGNASHELRTPLAITQTLLEVARADPSRDVETLLGHLQEINTRAIDLVDALLALSRSRQLTGPLDRVDLSLLAEQAAETLLPLAEARDISLRVEGDAAWVWGSAPLLLQVASNLLHNAIVHNRPRGGMIVVSTEASGQDAILCVENSGLPLPPLDLATLADPFQRGQGRSRTPGEERPGTGLGLAIVQNIVHAHRGSFTLAARARGGAITTVRLPRAGHDAREAPSPPARAPA